MHQHNESHHYLSKFLLSERKNAAGFSPLFFLGAEAREAVKNARLVKFLFSEVLGAVPDISRTDKKKLAEDHLITRKLVTLRNSKQKGHYQ